MSTAVIDDLAAIRTGIVRAALAKRFDVAFDLAAYLLVMDTSTRGTERPADIRLVRTSLRPMSRNSENDFAAANPGEKLENPPAGSWMKLGDDLKRFDAFRALPDAEKHDLFTRAVSAALYNQAANQHRALPIGERVVELLDIDFAKAVRPTEKYFWKRLTRARMLDIAERVVGKEWAKARRNHKKGQLAADMAAVFGDDPQDGPHSTPRRGSASNSGPCPASRPGTALRGSRRRRDEGPDSPWPMRLRPDGRAAARADRKDGRRRRRPARRPGGDPPPRRVSPRPLPQRGPRRRPRLHGRRRPARRHRLLLQRRYPPRHDDRRPREGDRRQPKLTPPKRTEPARHPAPHGHVSPEGLGATNA